MNSLFRTRSWLHGQTDHFLDLVRIYLGVGLFVKAVYFMNHRDYLLSLMDQSGNLWFAPAAIAHYVIVAHLFGGLLLAVGLLTRVAALAQLPVILGALFYLHIPRMLSVEPGQDFEFSALVLFLLVLTVIFGPGRWSVDAWIARKSPATEVTPGPVPQPH